jgi:pimeloyl-ACP methyl ester carboxylesterase
MALYSSKGYACYAPDMPGFGMSFDPSPADISLIAKEGTKWYCDVFMEAFSSIGILTKGSKMHIIGHHSGACLALELAVLYPELVQSICLVGPAIMSVEERAAMKEIYFSPFNEPVPDGSHLAKTWQYLSSMGIGPSLALQQREVIDHVRAWKGRNLIYGAVWDQDGMNLYEKVMCPVLLMCARDDVLWKYFGFVKGLREDVRAIEVQGGNFELDRDVDGIERGWTELLESSN